MKTVNIINEFANMAITDANIVIDRVNDYESAMAGDYVYESVMELLVCKRGIVAQLQYDLADGVNLQRVSISTSRNAPPVGCNIKLNSRPRATLADIDLADVFAEIADNRETIERLLNEAKNPAAIGLRDKFGRMREDGNVDVLFVDDGARVNRLDGFSDIYPVSNRSGCAADWETAHGIVLTLADAKKIGLTIE